eukprot:3515358-Prorocentrum_lima.AAC.1
MVAISPVRRCTWRGVSSVTRRWSCAWVSGVVSGSVAARVRAVPWCQQSLCVCVGLVPSCVAAWAAR